MARISTKVQMYKKGKADKGYWGTEDLKDTLWDIYKTHKSWGDDWYDKARVGAYESAKILLAIHGKGECRNKALDIIDELMERGDE
jgi:hypothetical protein